MSEPFLGEIKIMSFNFPPRGWALCNGQLLPINQNQALFALFGTTYGGNGQTNFALPDFRSRVPVHQGAGFTMGQRAGQEAHTLTISEIPAHNHFAVAVSNVQNSIAPTNNSFFAATTPSEFYSGAAPDTTMLPAMLGNQGGNQPHNNMQPYLTLNFCVALQGIFPSQN